MIVKFFRTVLHKGEITPMGGVFLAVVGAVRSVLAKLNL